MKLTNSIPASCAMTVLMLAPCALADTTFTYQGELRTNGEPATGSYNMDLSLWDALSGGNQIGDTVMYNGLPVTDGLFTVQLDFGAAAFDNSDRWLEISVNGSELVPRQPITRAPYAIQTRGLFVDENDNVGIGTTSPERDLHVAGRILSDGIDGGSIEARNPNNPIASVSLNWDNDVARIRIAGEGPGAAGGLDIQRTGNNSLMRILHNGNVGIGTSSPTMKLHVVSAAGIALFSQALSTGGVGVFGAGVSTTGASVGVRGSSTSPGGVGVFGWAEAGSGTNFGVLGRSSSASGFDFYADGAGQDYGSSSSRRWKSNIVPIDLPLEKVARLRGVYFDWDKEHGGHHDVGMIAEEVGAVLPEIVIFEENGIDAHGMDYSKLTPLLVEAVNALRTENAELKMQNEELGVRLARLETLALGVQPK